MKIGVWALLWAAETDWREANDRGLEAYRGGKLAIAEAAFKAASNIAKEQEWRAQSLNNLGAVYYQRGEYDAAERSYREAVEAWGTPRHAGTLYGSCLVNLAVLLRQTGRLDEAESHSRMAVKFFGDSGIQGTALASAHQGLAETARMRGRWEDALEEVRAGERALAHAPDPFLRALLMQTEGNVWQDRNRPEIAVEFHRAAAAALEKRLGSTAPQTASAVAALGHALMTLERGPEAEAMLRRAVELCDRAYGSHPRTASAMNNLAQLLSSQRRYAEAEQLYRRSLEVMESKLGPKHPDVAKVLANFGDLMVSVGKARGAEACYRRALEIQRVEGIVDRLAHLLESQSRTTEARRLRLR